ncbi:MAG: DEAD/DEAH box helicase, partial [Bacteroidales bacterium]|jgi:SNF2 family DNA or RNA helicase|nr:DEAD/DEAH box helicase [Bacteroidales bacterium]
VPIEQKDRITKALIGYSTRVGVKGDFDDPYMLKKSGKTDLVVRIQPIGGDLNATVLVKPLSKDELRLIPGVGNAILTHRSPKGDRIQIKRSLKKEQKALHELKNIIPSFAEMDDNEMTFVEEVDTLSFLAEMRELAPKVELTWPKGESLKVAKVATMSDFNVGVKSNIDWFELSGKVAVDNEKLWSIKQLMEASAGGAKQFVKLDDNTYFKLTKALQKRLSELSSISVSKGDNLRVHRLGASALSAIVEDAGTSRTDKNWKDNLKNIENLRHFNPEIPSNLQAELRPYQTEGYNWLARLHAWGVGACLADDMGLGKTIQAIALMLKQANDGPCLVIAPSSVCPNWHKEIARFAPVLNAVGLGLQKRKQAIKALRAFDVLIVSYGIIQSNPDLLAEKEWNIVVLDEAHAIKNANSMRSKAAMKLQAKSKIITTGTPIQNHLGELWNLFQFINPGFLGSYESFNERFVNGSSQSEISAKRKALNHYIQPFILRRNKGDVLDDLPAKTEMTLTVEQSEDEKALYEVMRQKALENIEQSEEVGGAAHMQILAQISKLRLASCNPRLVEVGSNLISSKMSALEELVDNLLDANHKALVFSQFTKHLALIREMLDAKGISYQYLDGSSTTKQREKSIVDFQSGKSDLFLISLKAGGVGLNRTAADYVIHMDPWWNPAVEDQASDRAHRIGQTRPVTVYRLVAEGTIEEKIVKLHHAKRGLADDLLAGTDKSAKVSSTELFDLMR